MVSTIVPDSVHFMAIAMKEKARIRDKTPSSILDDAFESDADSDDAHAQEMSNNAEVRFFVSPAVNKTRSHIR